MKIKALALDLDGTALMPDNTLGGRTIGAVKNFMSRGGRVIICTGRAVEASEKYRAAFGAEGPMVFCNGAEVVDMPSGKVINANLLSMEALDFGIDLARSMGVHFHTYLPPGTGFGNGTYDALLTDKPTPESEMYQRHTGITPIFKDLKEVIKMPGVKGCIKAMFISDPSRHGEIKQKLIDRFGGSIYVTRTYETFLEVMNAGVSKGEGLKIAMNSLGLEPKEVIALGDEESDLAMFSVAGYSAAPENARENVKAAAGFIFPSNAREGLADFIEEQLPLL